MARPDRLVVVLGTATGVGKTWVAARLARALVDDGVAVAVRKPAQSFDPADALEETDAAVLAAATGEAPDDVCPPHRWYRRALAPPMAAEALGLPSFTVADLVAETHFPSGAGVGLVEGAGGPRSPVADDGDNVALAAALRPHLVVLVADAGLGTISDVRLAAGAIGGMALVVLLNRFDPDDDLHRRNRAWLAGRDGLAVTTSVAQLASRVRG